MTQQTAASALFIIDGACNSRAVARSLVKAIDAATEVAGSDGAQDDPAVALIMSRLAQLVHYSDGLDVPSLNTFGANLEACRRMAGSCGDPEVHNDV